MLDKDGSILKVMFGVDIKYRMFQFFNTIRCRIPTPQISSKFVPVGCENSSKPKRHIIKNLQRFMVLAFSVQCERVRSFQ